MRSTAMTRNVETRSLGLDARLCLFQGWCPHIGEGLWFGQCLAVKSFVWPLTSYFHKPRQYTHQIKQQGPFVLVSATEAKRLITNLTATHCHPLHHQQGSKNEGSG